VKRRLFYLLAGLVGVSTGCLAQHQDNTLNGPVSPIQGRADTITASVLTKGSLASSALLAETALQGLSASDGSLGYEEKYNPREHRVVSADLVNSGRMDESQYCIANGIVEQNTGLVSRASLDLGSLAGVSDTGSGFVSRNIGFNEWTMGTDLYGYEIPMGPLFGWSQYSSSLTLTTLSNSLHRPQPSSLLYLGFGLVTLASISRFKKTRYLLCKRKTEPL
jgi:hypothetical protein